MKTKKEIKRRRVKLRRFKRLSRRFPAIIPLAGKKAIEKNWNRYCEEKRLFIKEEFTNYNAGLPAGPANGIIVLDVDKFKKTEKFLEDKGWETPETFTVRTGRKAKAIHLYYKYPDDGKVYGNHKQPDPDDPKKSIFEIKGVGGYVVASGSIHPDTGKTYKIIRDYPIAPAPKWLLDIAEKKTVIKESPEDTKPALNDLIGNFLGKLKGVESRGPKQWMALCPAHDDHDPSLSIEVGEDGRILIHCFAECPTEKIISALGIDWGDLFPSAKDQAWAIIDSLRSSKNLEDVFAHAPTFAKLDHADFALLKKELKGIFEGDLNLNDFTKTVNAARKVKTEDDPGLPIIPASNRRLAEISADALLSLSEANDPPKIFIRGGALARIRTDEHGWPMIEMLTEAHLRGELTRAADFVNERHKHVDPPKNMLNDILTLPQWDFPPLEGIVQCPVLRPDGTILDSPGYDKSTGLYYFPEKNLSMPSIPESPTERDLERALHLILKELLGDFPFVDRASIANAVAKLLTDIARPTIPGLVPMAVLDSPDKGTGKGLLADVNAIIATGKPAPSTPVPSMEEEWRKKITSLLMDGSPLVSLDNVVHPLNSSSLASALTAEVWEDRVLGINKIVKLKNRATWMLNGNNVKIVGDLIRRCFWIRMDAKTAKPWERTNFRHKKLRKWVRIHRGELLAALLTIIRTWFVAGKPKPKGLKLGSFEEWEETLRGILSCAHIPGFLANQEKFYEITDEERQQWKGFIAKLREHYHKIRFTAQELTEEVRNDVPLRSLLPESLAATLHDPKRSFERSLGKSLAQKEGVRHDFGNFNLYLKRAGNRGHAVIWRVKREAKDKNS